MGDKPKMTKVVFSGSVDSNIFVLFESMYYIIVVIVNGQVESFSP